MRTLFMTGLLTLSVISVPALAQMSPQGGGAVTTKQGSAQKTQIVTASVLITSIDRATRTLTLQGADGRVVDVVAGPEVHNFDQLKLNDEVVVEYMLSLSLTLQKIRSDDTSSIAVTEAAVRAKPGQQPGAGVGQSIAAIAVVIDVNSAKHTITLKGPRGNAIELDVQNPDQFKVVKVGDQVKVEYTETVALSVQPAAKKTK